MVINKRFSTNFHRVHVHLYELFSPQLNGQTDSDSVSNTLSLHSSNENHSLDTNHDQITPDAEKLKNGVINVFTQTNCDNSPESKVSPNH